MTTLNEFQKICNATAKRDFDTKVEEIMCWAIGLTGEAGDVASCIKKVYVHKNESQKSGIRENVGDTLWYIAMICNFFNWNLEEVLEENVEKLKKRYPNGFTLEEAQRSGTRVDWNEEVGK